MNIFISFIIGVALGLLIMMAMVKDAFEQLDVRFSKSDFKSISEQINKIAKQHENDAKGEYELVITYRDVIINSNSTGAGALLIPIKIHDEAKDR